MYHVSIGRWRLQARRGIIDPITASENSVTDNTWLHVTTIRHVCVGDLGQSGNACKEPVGKASREGTTERQQVGGSR